MGVVHSVDLSRRLRATTKKGHQLCLGKSAPRYKILATPMAGLGTKVPGGIQRSTYGGSLGGSSRS